MAGETAAAHPSRVGVLGGTFDPIHIAHLALGIAAVDQLELDRLLFVVANDPWQKSGSRAITPATVRLRMVEAAVAGHERLVASALEIERGGPSYTVDTLAALASDATELFLVIGSDIVGDLTTWKRWRDVAAMATLAIAQRPGEHVETLPEEFAAVSVDLPLLSLSSTELREMTGFGRPLDFLVPDGVRDVIRSANLYRETS